jgi:RNA polymerase sigma-70 factor (ECF subfamily)
LETTVFLRDLQVGDHSAFEVLVDQYQKPIIRYLYRLTGDSELSRELAQDTFVKAYQNIAKTDSNLKLNAWLYRIATNNALQYLRRKKLIGFIPLENVKKSVNTSDGSHPKDPIEDIVIRETLNKIPHDQRICLILYYIDGFKCREIAESIEITEAAVQKRIARGAKLFRQIYKGGDR